MDNQEKNMVAVTYIRVSTKEQVDNFSLDFQDKECTEFCQKQAWKLDRIFREEGESAKTANRPELLKLLEYCQKNKGKIDVVLVYRLDRISRNSSDYHAIRATLAKYGIVLRSVTEPISESSQGRFMQNIYAAVAQLDNDVRAERTKEGLKERVKQGLWAWGAPLGYKNTPAGLVVDEKYAPYVKKAFELYAQGCYTIKQVAVMMNKWGVRTRKGHKILPQTVTKMLENKLYIGVIAVEGWDEVPGVHEPIISEEIFRKAQLVRKGKSFTAVPRLVNNPNFPLKNIAKCHSCDSFLTASISRGRSKRYAYYHCICGKTRISKEELENAFHDSLMQIQPNQDFVKLFSAVLYDVWKRKLADASNQVLRLDNEIQTIKQLKNKLLQKNLSGVVNDEDYKEQSEILSAQLTVKEIERSEYRSEEANIDYYVAMSENLFNNVSTIWLDAPFDHKLRFQSLLFPSGVTYQEGIIRTTSLGLPFNLISDLAGEKTNLVKEI
jgi:DNA invertase Pin-like site-specific DNA recombinase